MLDPNSNVAFEPNRVAEPKNALGPDVKLCGSVF